ncbi:hypothetical protein RAD15_11970 [Bradyrhizobium sp. 14AA]
MSHYTERLDTKRLHLESLDLGSLGLPAARIPAFLRHFYRSTRRLLRSVIARIDLSQFPGSCCG